MARGVQVLLLKLEILVWCYPHPSLFCNPPPPPPPPPRLAVLQRFSGWLSKKLRRESAHAHNFQYKISIKSARMRGFSAQFLDNQPENRCTVDIHIMCLQTVQHCHTPDYCRSSHFERLPIGLPILAILFSMIVMLHAGIPYCCTISP